MVNWWKELTYQVIHPVLTLETPVRVHFRVPGGGAIFPRPFAVNKTARMRCDAKEQSQQEQVIVAKRDLILSSHGLCTMASPQGAMLTAKLTEIGFRNSSLKFRWVKELPKGAGPRMIEAMSLAPS